MVPPASGGRLTGCSRSGSDSRDNSHHKGLSNQDSHRAGVPNAQTAGGECYLPFHGLMESFTPNGPSSYMSVYVKESMRLRTDLALLTTIFYSSCPQELVEYYKHHSLKEGFRSLDTTLQFPYKEPEPAAGQRGGRVGSSCKY